MQWKCNGLLIAKAEPNEHVKPGSSYRGVAYGLPWPLNRIYDNLSKNEQQLVDRIRELTIYHTVKRADGLPTRPVTGDDSFAPVLLNDAKLAAKYIDCCRAHAIPTRCLLCATTSGLPEMNETDVDNILNNARFLAYDYASADCTFSAVNQDLIWAASAEPRENLHWIEPGIYAELIARLSKHASWLNGCGLFDSPGHLEEYIAERWEVARLAHAASGNDTQGLLEDAMELWPYRVSEVFSDPNP